MDWAVVQTASRRGMQPGTLAPLGSADERAAACGLLDALSRDLDTIARAPRALSPAGDGTQPILASAAIDAGAMRAPERLRIAVTAMKPLAAAQAVPKGDDYGCRDRPSAPTH